MKLKCACNGKVNLFWKNVQNTNYNIHKCEKCDILICDRIIEDKIENIYIDDDLYHIKEQIKIGHVPYKDRFDNDYAIAKQRITKFNQFLSFDIKGKRVLDIGCSNGAFLKYCSDNGALINGIEPNGNIANFAIDKLKDIFEKDNSQFIEIGLIENIKMNQLFDYVFMHDIIEHVKSPKLILHLIKNLLHEKSIVVIDTPDLKSKSFLEQQQNWKHIRPIEHLWYFTEQNLLNITSKIGFKHIYTDYPIEGKFVLYLESVNND